MQLIFLQDMYHIIIHGKMQNVICSKGELQPSCANPS